MIFRNLIVQAVYSSSRDKLSTCTILFLHHFLVMHPHRLFFFTLLCLPQILLAQHRHNDRDTMQQQIGIEEVLILNKQGVNNSRQSTQRASKQMSTDKILDHIPEVQMIRRGNYAWEPTIRSLNVGQINVTIDGMHIFGACTDRMDPVSSYIEPTNLQQLTINAGPGADNYGGSIGGGVDFKLVNASVGDTEKLKALIGSGYESNGNAVQTLASMHYSTSKFAIQANTIFRKSQSYHSANNTVVPFSQYEKWNTALATTYRINHHHELSADYLFDEGRNIGYPALTMDVAFAKAHITSLTHHFHDKNRWIPHIKSKVYYNFIDHAMDDTKRPPEQISMHMDMPGKSWTGGFYNELSTHLNRHSMKIRTSGYLNRLTADMTMYPENATPMYMYTIPNAQRIFLALDLHHRYTFNEYWHINSNSTLSSIHSTLYNQAGRDQLSGFLTGQNPNRNDLLLNLRTGVTYHPSSKWDFRANIGHATRNASLQEYYGFYIYNRLDAFDYLGNDALKNESAFQIDLGTTYDHQWLRIEANAFGYLFSDYIVGRILPEFQEMTIGANGVKQYTNIPSARLLGTEFSVRAKISNRLSLLSSNTYTNGKDNDGHALPMISPFRSMNSLYINILGISGQIDAEYNASQKHISTIRYGETSTPSSMIFNIEARKDFTLAGKMFKALFRVENILDSHYYRHLDIMKIARPGRNFMMQLNVSL